MSLTCPNCGAENRDTAKFCLKCAQQLVPLGKAAPAPAEARRKRRRRRPAADANAALDATSAANSSLHLHGFLIAMAALLLAALIGVMLAQRNTAAPAGANKAAAVPPAVAPAKSAFTPRATAPASTPAMAALPPPPPSLAAAPMLAALPPARPASTATAPSRGEPAVRQARGAKPSPRASAAAAPAPAASEPAPPAPRPAPAPAAPATPSALCSDARFLAHAICLQNQCNKPALRQHPQCVRMHEQQEALRRGSGDN